MKVPSRNTADASDTPVVKDLPSKRFSKLRITKNVIVLSVGIHLLFTSYDGLAMMQSTMNREQGIGVISQAVCYICFSISAVLFPKYFIKKLGSKMTFAFSMFTYLPYVASNFYSHWTLMIPTAILIGLGAALLWGSVAIYLNDLSMMYSELIMNAKERRKSIYNDSPRNSRTLHESGKNNCARSLSCDPNYSAMCSNDFNNVNIKLCNSIDTKRSSIPITEKPRIPCMEIDDVNQYVDGDIFHENEKRDYVAFRKTENLSESEISLYSTKSVVPSTQQVKVNYRDTLIESITARFFGINGVAFFSSKITSNLMTYFILQSEIPEDTKSNFSSTCGANYCSVESTYFEKNIAGPSDQMRYILTAVCVCIGIASVLIVLIFLDPLEAKKEEVSFSMDVLMATYKLAKRTKLLLLIPFSLYVGMVMGFFAGDFNKSYVGCAWGTYHVGLVAVCF